MISTTLASLATIAERMPASPVGAARAAVIAHTDCPICDARIGETCQGYAGGALHYERIEVFQRVVMPDLWPVSGKRAPASTPAPPPEAPRVAHAGPRLKSCSARLWPVEGQGGNTIGWSCNVCGGKFTLTSIYAPRAGSPTANTGPA